jgi:uncharacterized protein YgiM (DUF1202 family)
LILVVTALMLVLTACGIDLQLPLTSEQPEAATIVALTLQAAGTPAGPFEQPMLEITANTNCRSGPGGSYALITAFTAGTKLEIVARNSANNFWQVKLPGTEDTCWVWGQYATASGSYESLPESAPGDQASGADVPARPSSLFFDYTCPFGNLTTNLSWGDAADNESGYRVYRFDQLVADLPPNTTAYTDVVTVTPHAALQYSVEAYNSADSSARRTISFSCE